jgi:hypothetical protein
MKPSPEHPGKSAMATPETVPTQASVADFIQGEPGAERQADCLARVQLMDCASGEPACLWGTGIVGFGTCNVSHAGGRTAPWPLIAFAPRKSDLTLYLSHGFAAYEALMARLGKHKSGKGCLYIRRLADVDAGVLRQLVEGAVAARAAGRVAAGATA